MLYCIYMYVFKPQKQLFNEYKVWTKRYIIYFAHLSDISTCKIALHFIPCHVSLFMDLIFFFGLCIYVNISLLNLYKTKSILLSANVCYRKNCLFSFCENNKLDDRK